MTQLRIPKGKPRISDGIIDILRHSLIIKVEIEDVI
jgi:hypothetical protein